MARSDDPRPIDRRDGLALPVERIDGAPGTGRRGRLVAGLVALAAVALVGAGFAGRQLAPVPVLPPASVVPSATSTVRASELPAAAPATLPVVASTPLRDAPLLTLWRRDGDEAQVLAWDPRAPDAPPRIVEEVPGLLRGVPDDADVLLADSPSGRFTLLSELSSGSNGDDVETIRVADRGGSVAWSTALRGAVLVAPAWTPGRDQLVIPAPGAWLTASFGTGRIPSQASIPVPTFQREWSAGGPHPLVPKIAGFSADGETVYAAAIDSPFGLGIRPLLAIDLATRQATRISALPGRLADETGRGGPPDLTLVDPETGHVVGLPPPGGSAVRIFGTDGVTSKALIRRPVVLGASWTSSGRLAVLSTTTRAAADPFASPGGAGGPNTAATKLELFAGSGAPVRTAFATDHAERGTLVPAPDGYSLALFGSDQAVELVLVRLDDGATAAVTLPASDLDGVRFLGWRTADAPPGG
ncbi:MAG TPA: hypothetical protein VFS32_14325 [Candidatus Limnocylindrales bacterium]|nr:hypothetical protein [Candidatus Limnocylindrales bacterium]